MYSSDSNWEQNTTKAGRGRGSNCVIKFRAGVEVKRVGKAPHPIS